MSRAKKYNLKSRETTAPPNSELRIIPIPIEQEISPGDDLAHEFLSALRRKRIDFRSGDVLVVKHKIVSKSEGRIVDLKTIHPSADSIACAHSGVDVSNVNGGEHALLLPEDSDRSAANLRRALKKLTGIALPVIITDSFGRPWREGLTEFAIGIAGMKPLRDDRGRRDPHGYQLKASVEAVADELACAAGLVCGKLNRAPACIVRGFRYNPGAGRVRDLLRDPSADLFR